MPAGLAFPSDSPASIAMNTNAAAAPRVFCYAFAFCAVELRKNFERSRPAMSQENLRDAHALFTASPDFAITQVHEVDDRLLKRPAMSQENLCDAHALLTASPDFAITQELKVEERVRTLAPPAIKQILGTACTASYCALNCARPSRDSLSISHASPACDELLFTSSGDLTLTVLPKLQHLHRAAITQACAADTHTRSDVWSCTPLNLAHFHIKCLPQRLLFYSHRSANTNFNFSAARRLFQFAMNAEAEYKLVIGVTIQKLKVDSATIGRLRECANYKVFVEGLDRAFLPHISSEDSARCASRC